MASHDLKEPLRKIKTFSNRIAQEFSGDLPDKIKGYLDKVQSASDRMFSMINGVLNYSSLSASEQPIERVNLNQVIKNVESDLEVLIQQKAAIIKAGPLPIIEGASVLIYQLFYNLINNSLKFSRPDVKPVISITGKDSDLSKNYTVIELRDNGIGFEQEYAERIFETFSRLHSKDQYEGTGLGLALCKKIVLRHGGTIRADGDLEIGAVFIVTLPLRQDKQHI